jgi:histidine triad (HIT) family protein
MTDCLFCKIVAKEIPADVVGETATTLAFRDISPKAPTHVLVIPKTHFRDISELSRDSDAAANLLAAAASVAENEGLEHFRLVFNTGSEAGQSVFHVHAHVLGGRAMSWPPG